MSTKWKSQDFPFCIIQKRNAYQWVSDKDLAPHILCDSYCNSSDLFYNCRIEASGSKLGTERACGAERESREEDVTDLELPDLHLEHVLLNHFLCYCHVLQGKKATHWVINLECEWGYLLESWIKNKSCQAYWEMMLIWLREKIQGIHSKGLMCFHPNHCLGWYATRQ